MHRPMQHRSDPPSRDTRALFPWTLAPHLACKTLPPLILLLPSEPHHNHRQPLAFSNSHLPRPSFAMSHSQDASVADDELKPSTTEGYKVGEKKTLDEYTQLDANDESLAVSARATRLKHRADDQQS